MQPLPDLFLSSLDTNAPHRPFVYAIPLKGSKKFDKHLYHQLYLDCKAARYNSKRNLADGVDKILAKKKLEQKIAEQKKAKNEKK